MDTPLPMPLRERVVRFGALIDNDDGLGRWVEGEEALNRFDDDRPAVVGRDGDRDHAGLLVSRSATAAFTPSTPRSNVHVPMISTERRAILPRRTGSLTRRAIDTAKASASPAG